MPRKPLYKVRMVQWVEELDGRMLSSCTIDTYRKLMRLTFRYAADHDWPGDPRKIKPNMIRGYYDDLQNLSSSTQLGRLGTLLRFLDWCGNEHCSKIKLRIQVSRSRVDWLTEDQVALILSTAPRCQVGAMETCFALTGIRRAELCKLRFKDVREREIVVGGKGRKERTIPVNEKFWGWIAPYLAYRDRLPSHNLFLIHRVRNTDRSSGYHVGTVTEALMDHGQTLGFHMTPHTLRRTFGRLMYKNGCPLGELSRILGHSSVEMTMRYLGIGSEDLSDAIDKYLPEFQLRKEATTVSGFLPGSG